MRILVTAASRHGSTFEIAEVIAEELRRRGHAVDMCEIGEVADLGPYEAAVVGSAVYVGRWMPAGLELAARLGNEGGSRRVWAFSSGPVGGATDVPVDVDEVVRLLHPVSHELFGGRLDGARLTPAQVSAANALGASVGDFRDMAAVRRWAASIDDELRGLPAGSAMEPARWAWQPGWA